MKPSENNPHFIFLRNKFPEWTVTDAELFVGYVEKNINEGVHVDEARKVALDNIYKSKPWLKR
jgi:hypothetical protein